MPSCGPADAEIAFVGEAPGYQEKVKGTPFVGPGGQLLNKVMMHHRIKRSEVILSNACLCAPPDNGTPPKAAIAACKPRLLAELASVRTVVALGNVATQTLLGESGITRLRVGPPRLSPYLPDLRVVPTIHPAACLRQGDNFPFLVTDIGKIRLSATSWRPPTVVVCETPQQALQIFEGFRQRSMNIVVDIEVDIDKDNSFDHPNRHGMLCVGLADSKDVGYVLTPASLDETVWAALGELLRDAFVIAQNGKFDLAGLYRYVGHVDLDFDTMLAHYCLDERRGIHGLKQMAQEYLGAPAYDEEIKKYVGSGVGYGNIPKPLLYRYNGYDVTCTFGLFEVFTSLLDKTPELWDVHNLLVLASRELMYVELNGIAIDGGYIDQLTDEYLGRLEILVEELRSVVAEKNIELTNSAGRSIDFNPASPLQVKKVLHKLGVKVASTNEDILTKVLEMGLERYGPTFKTTATARFVTLLLKHRREAKLYGTYVKGIRTRRYRGRVYPTFLLHGTTTGRLSCRNPNLQNVPRESSIRRLFIPAKPGFVFVQSDYSQAELRVLCYLAGDQYFRGIFNSGDRDLFDELTPILYPRLGRKEDVTPAIWKETRIRVKAYVYGLAYGREAESIAEEFNISVGEASRGMKAFFGVIPEIVSFREETKQKVFAGEDLITPFGRHRRFPLITRENAKGTENEALAFLPQSTASDMCLQAMAWSRRELKGTGWVRNIVHDSILAECHSEDAEEVAGILNKNMLLSAKSIVGDYVTFATDYKVGANWGEV